MGLQTKLLFLLEILQTADARPTAQALRAVDELTELVVQLQDRWDGLDPAARRSSLPSSPRSASDPAGQ